jgi:Fe-S-cluster containining protein
LTKDVNMLGFPCIQCGECCRNIGNLEFLADFNDGSGVCLNLIGNSCKIYETRPLFCNISKAYEAAYKEVISEFDFIVCNLKVCLDLNHRIGDESKCLQLRNLLQRLQSRNIKLDSTIY